MPTSLHSKEYNFLTKMLVDARKQTGLTQQQVASLLKRPQSFVAKYEGRERRLDVIEFIEICRILKCDPLHITRLIARMIDG